MEWETASAAELRREEEKPRFRGRMATHELARKEMAEELARIQGRKRRAPRLEALQRAAQAWQGKEAEEELKKRQEQREKAAPSMEVARMRDVKTEDEFKKSMKQEAAPSIEVIPLRNVKTEARVQEQPQDLGIAGWLQQRLARWAARNRPQSRKEGRRLNSATLAVMLRKAVAREKALAFGRPLTNPRAVALEQEAARWKEREEEKRRLILRETGMLQKLVQFMARDEFFDESKRDEFWTVGRVSCLVDKVPQDGWNLIVIALERSPFMLRWGWGELLGLYHAELDDQLNLKNYIRVTPEDLEEYLQEQNLMTKEGEHAKRY